MQNRTLKPGLFIAYKQSPVRKELIENPSDRPENYLLWGLEGYRSKGFCVMHNLDRLETPLESRINRTINKFLKLFGAPGGDWMTIIRNRRAINGCDAMLSTVDNVGLPAVILKRFGVINVPVIYISVGLPEQLQKIRTGVARTLYLRSLKRTERFICYSTVEREHLKTLLQRNGKTVSFIPLGIMTSFFNPVPAAERQWDIVSIGADPMRDYPLLTQFAGKHEALKVLVVTSANHSYVKKNKPENLDCEFNITLEEVIGRVAAGKLVVLPVKKNTYSGATTTLLQAMCLQKCVIVSSVGPIQNGYHLNSGVNCIMVEPGNYAELEGAILSALSDEPLLERTGMNGRETVLRNNTWESFISRTANLILEVIGEREPSCKPNIHPDQNAS